MSAGRSWLESGSRNGYAWLVSTDMLSDVLRLCPEVVLNRYVAITAFDSGPLEPLCEEEKSKGWETSGSITYSPRIQNPLDLPYDNFDEWYIFPNRVTLGELAPSSQLVSEREAQKGRVHVFVNYGAFALHEPEFAEHAKLFWKQLDWIRPESFIAEGDNLNFVTADRRLFGAVRDALLGLRE